MPTNLLWWVVLFTWRNAVTSRWQILIWHFICQTANLISCQNIAAVAYVSAPPDWFFVSPRKNSRETLCIEGNINSFTSKRYAFEGAWVEGGRAEGLQKHFYVFWGFEKGSKKEDTLNKNHTNQGNEIGKASHPTVIAYHLRTDLLP